MNNLKLITHNAEETQQLGISIGKLAEPGDIFLLIGELGAGKTCLTQGIAYGLVAPLFEQGKVCATHLAQFGSKVYLVHRRGELRASKILRERAHKNPKIEIIWNKVVEEFLGDKTLTAVKMKDTVTGDLSTLEVAGAFEAIGHKPNTAFLKGQVTTDEAGYIITKPGTTETSKEGVFAAGDVQDPLFRQAITSAASGCMAALETEWWLQDQSK